MNSPTAPMVPLKLRIGQCELSVEVPIEAVQESIANFSKLALDYASDFQIFADHLKGSASYRALHNAATENPLPFANRAEFSHQNEWPDAASFDRVFAEDEHGLIYLRRLPKTEPRELDALLVLLYGHLLRNKNRSVRAGYLLRGGKQSGLILGDRVNTILDHFPNLVERTGKRHTSRYALTIAGIGYAQNLFHDLVA